MNSILKWALIGVIILVGAVLIREGTPLLTRAFTHYFDLLRCAGFHNSRALGCLIEFICINGLLAFILRQLMRFR